MANKDKWEPEDVGYVDTPVVRLATDLDNYAVSSDQVVRSTVGTRFGLEPVVVPRARKDGRSSAFYPHVAAPVHVDPDLRDGVVVDLSKVTKTDMSAALRRSRKPHLVFSALANATAGRPDTAAVESGVDDSSVRALSYGVGIATPYDFNAGHYVTPRSLADGTQLTATEANEVVMKPLPGHSRPTPAARPSAPAEPPAYPAPAFSQPIVVQAQPDYGVLNAVQAIAASVQSISDRVVALESSRPVTAAPRQAAPLSPADTATLPSGRKHARKQQPIDVGYEPEEDDEPDDDSDGGDPAAHRRHQRVESLGDLGEHARRARTRQQQHVADMEERPRDGLIVGFETLRIPFITGPKPDKARRRVYFEYPGMGRQAASYHAVIIAKDVIVLVYDTRYEDGSQFEPPALDPETTVTLHVTGAKETATYAVASMGLSFKLGVLEMVVLMRKEESAQPFDSADE